MAKHNFGIHFSGAAIVLPFLFLFLFATLAVADVTIKTSVSFEDGNTALIADSPIGSLVSDLNHDTSDNANIKAEAACARRLEQVGGDEQCAAVLRNVIGMPNRKCCNAMADLDQDAPECWFYLIGGPHWNKHLFTLNELCVTRSSF